MVWKKRIRRCLMLFIFPLSLLSLSGCSSNNVTDLSVIKATAKEAYIFAYPMLENYKTMQTQAISSENFNGFTHSTHLQGPEYKDIVRPNNDTLYSTLWMDLRAEPLVIQIPSVTDRYYSFQMVDMYTYNFAYAGTRTTGTQARTLLVAGPNWKGTAPRNVDDLFVSEGNFVLCLGRTAVNPDVPGDLERVLDIQKQYCVQPLSTYLGQAAPTPPPMDIFPLYEKTEAASVEFIGLFNFLLGQLVIDPSESDMINRFGLIGIGPNYPFDASKLDSSIKNAIEEGIAEALEEITHSGALLGEEKNAWTLTKRIFGNREQMQGQYLVRAGAAAMGIYGNNLEEAYYPSTEKDMQGLPLDASNGRSYLLTFSREDLPQVKEAGFWSITMYNLPDQLMVENPIHRYSLGDRTNLAYQDDGSLEIIIQTTSPDQGNWLPAPEGPFSLTMRMYLPEEEALDPLYGPPALKNKRLAFPQFTEQPPTLAGAALFFPSTPSALTKSKENLYYKHNLISGTGCPI